LLALLLTWFFWSQKTDFQQSWWWILCWPLALWGLREGLQPVPEVFDLLGMLGLWWLILSSDRQRVMAVFFLFLAWGNLGPRPIWGLLLLAGLSLRHSVGGWTWGAAILGGMATPRGFWTWIDSTILFAPQSFYVLPMRNIASARGLLGGADWGPPEVLFLLLWAIWILSSRRDFPWKRQLPRFGIPLLAILLCRENLPESSLWIALDLFAGGKARSTAKSDSEQIETSLKRFRWQHWGTAAGGCLAGLLMLADAVGLLDIKSRMGAGIAPEIDVRLLNADLLTKKGERVIAWAPDGRSIGCVAWLHGNTVPFDHPRRAWLGGRWREFVGLWNDVRLNRGPAYRREDETWGGWIQQMAGWKIGMLLIPVEDRMLHRSLVETSWKPGDLDSASIPYLSADDPRYFADIVEGLGQRYLVEAGAWLPAEEVYDSQGWRWDAMEQFGLGRDPRPPCLQAEIFRATGLPMASLRALRLARRQTLSGPLFQEWVNCQVALAWQEWTDFGKASSFRSEVVKTLGRLHDLPPIDGGLDTRPETQFGESIPLYLQGRLTEALAALPLTNPEQHFAAAMLALELGDVARARDELSAGLDKNPERSIAVALRSWQQDLSFEPGRKTP
jgi:hypothetical protein